MCDTHSNDQQTDFVAWAKTHVKTKRLLASMDDTKRQAQRTVDPRRLRSMTNKSETQGGKNPRDARIMSRVAGKELLSSMAKVSWLFVIK